MEQDGWTGRTVTLKYKLDTYQGVCFKNVIKDLFHKVIVFNRAKSFDRWVSTKEELYNVSGLLQASPLFDYTSFIDRQRIIGPRISPENKVDRS